MRKITHRQFAIFASVLFYLHFVHSYIEFNKSVFIRPRTALVISQHELINHYCSKNLIQKIEVSIECNQPECQKMSYVYYHNEYHPSSQYKEKCQSMQNKVSLDFSANDILSNEFESVSLILDYGRFCKKEQPPSDHEVRLDMLIVITFQDISNFWILKICWIKRWGVDSA